MSGPTSSIGFRNHRRQNSAAARQHAPAIAEAAPLGGADSTPACSSATASMRIPGPLRNDRPGREIKTGDELLIDIEKSTLTNLQAKTTTSSRWGTWRRSRSRPAGRTFNTHKQSGMMAGDARRCTLDFGLIDSITAAGYNGVEECPLRFTATRPKFVSR